MQIQTVLWVLLALIVALGFALFQYKNSRIENRLKILLASLRFLLFFGGLLLLINPEFVRNSYTTEKSNLVLLVDGSSSMLHSKDGLSVEKVLDELTTDEQITNKFDLHRYQFDKEVRLMDTLSFGGKITNIRKGLETIKQTFANSKNRIVLISDGNQTFGQDYGFFNIGPQSRLDAVIIGDTTKFQDLGIGLLNSNRYGFLNNQFPVEAQLFYSGNSNVSTTARIALNGQVIHRETIDFSATKRTHTLQKNIKARSTGIKTIQIELTPLQNERNKDNNIKEATIEIIDEKTIVGIVSSIRHPDIGALKKSIESNEQREVILLEPEALSEQLENIDAFILYQPNVTFEPLFEYLQNSGNGSFIITGTQTDWNYLNTRVQGFSFEAYGQNEEILAVKNDGFGLFDITTFDTSIFPPLKGALGELNFNLEPKVIADQRIRGVNLEVPLLFVLENGKQAFLLGENIWKWRLNTYRNTNSFAAFDEFMAKMMFFLSSSGRKERLQLDYENVFENASEAEIRATFYDKTFELDSNANLNITITGENGFKRNIPMLFLGGQFSANLSDLDEGVYTFTVMETRERISKSGQFKISDFDLEKQFISANDDKLKSLAENNSGQLFYSDKLKDLMDDLVKDTAFVPIQKSTKNVVTLIDFHIVLAVLVLFLALEWFIRKYNGLI